MRKIVKILTILLVFINLPQAQAGKLCDWFANVSDYNEAKIRMFHYAQGFLGVEPCSGRYYNSRKKLENIMVHQKCNISGKYASSYNDRYKQREELLSDQLKKYIENVLSDDNLHFSRHEVDKLAGFIVRLDKIFKDEQEITAEAIRKTKSQINEPETTINDTNKNSINKNDTDKANMDDASTSDFEESNIGDGKLDHSEVLLDNIGDHNDTTPLIQTSS